MSKSCLANLFTVRQAYTLARFQPLQITSHEITKPVYEAVSAAAMIQKSEAINYLTALR